MSEIVFHPEAILLVEDDGITVADPDPSGHGAMTVRGRILLDTSFARAVLRLSVLWEDPEMAREMGEPRWSEKLWLLSQDDSRYPFAQIEPGIISFAEAVPFYGIEIRLDRGGRLIIRLLREDQPVEHVIPLRERGDIWMPLLRIHGCTVVPGPGEPTRVTLAAVHAVPGRPIAKVTVIAGREAIARTVSLPRPPALEVGDGAIALLSFEGSAAPVPMFWPIRPAVAEPKAIPVGTDALPLCAVPIPGTTGTVGVLLADRNGLAWEVWAAARGIERERAVRLGDVRSPIETARIDLAREEVVMLGERTLLALPLAP